MERAIITGPTGVLGTALIEKLIRKKIEIIAVCRIGSERIGCIPSDPLITVMECNLDSLRVLPRMISGHKYKDTVFFHMGWDGTFGGDRDNLKSQINNIQYTVDAVSAAHVIGCRRFVGIGSQAEYGRVDSARCTRIKPDTPAAPENGYGVAKLCAGQMSRIKCQQVGMEHVWVRALSIYGPNDGRNTLISVMLDRLQKKEHISCTKGDQMWDYLYSSDAAEALFFLGCAEKEKVDGKIYVMGSGQARPLREYMYIVRDIVDPEAQLGIGEIPYSDKQIMYLWADISSLYEDTGFTPRISFEEGIYRTMNWMREKKGLCN